MDFHPAIMPCCGLSGARAGWRSGKSVDNFANNFVQSLAVQRKI
jgi:hypothetical protein